MWINQVYTVLASGTYSTPLSYATNYSVSCSLNNTTLTVVCPDGVTRTVTNAALATLEGNFAGLEIAPTVAATDHKPEFVSFSATTAVEALSHNLWNNTAPITLDATSLAPLLSATYNTTAGRAGYVVTTAAYSRLAASVSIPTGWRSVDITIEWANFGAGAGNVLWAGFIGKTLDGADQTATPPDYAFAGTAVTAGTLSVLKRSTFSTAIKPGVNRLWIQRNGPDAADTLANDVILYGLTFTRTG